MNPFLRLVNQPIPFQSLSANHVGEAVQVTLAEADGVLQSILKADPLTVDTVLVPLDRLYHTVYRVFNPIYLMAETHPQEAIRSACREAIEAFSSWLNTLAINEDLYKVVKAYESTSEARLLTGVMKRYLDDTIMGFRRSGFDLTADDRDRLKSIRIDIDKLSLDFQKNIADSTSASLAIPIGEATGLPADYVEARKQADGTLHVDLSYPSYVPFMKYCRSELWREQLWRLYNQRAWPANLDLLDQLLIKRHELATVLGYRSYAAYATEDRMAKTPETVWKFEQDLTEKVRQKASADYQLLLEEKRSFTGQTDVVVHEWDSAFYSNRIKETRYSVNDQEVKHYFELNSVLDGLFRINGTILGLTFREVTTPAVWHETVRQFEVVDQKTNRPIGTFYLDLFPRENKYSHAAMFPLVSGISLGADYERPVAALVCNFPAATPSQPSLLLFSDVNTLFHEFGHLLHGMVTTSPLQAYAGTNVLLDFVETPSQFFENFLYDYPTVSSFARHYQTGDPFPSDLFNRILSARNLGSGLFAQSQLLYGTLDFTLHDGFIPSPEKTTTDVLKQLKSEQTHFPWKDGNYFHAAFGHLSGYAAGYYSYLWAKVYAQDIWSVFESTGASDPATGLKFRETILEPGGTRDPMELVENFLGRKPDTAAFLRDLGV